MNCVPDDIKLPNFAKVSCEDCKKLYWLKFSRFNPQAYTLEEFNELYVIDEENKSIKPTEKHARGRQILEIIWNSNEWKEALGKIHNDIVNDILSGIPDESGFHGQSLYDLINKALYGKQGGCIYLLWLLLMTAELTVNQLVFGSGYVSKHQKSCR